MPRPLTAATLLPVVQFTSSLSQLLYRAAPKPLCAMQSPPSAASLSPPNDSAALQWPLSTTPIISPCCFDSLPLLLCPFTPAVRELSPIYSKTFPRCPNTLLSCSKHSTHRPAFSENSSALQQKPFRKKPTKQAQQAASSRKLRTLIFL